MTLRQHSIIRIAIMLALCALPFSSMALIKCWTNKDGVRECGNTVPPEYAQRGHKELNEFAITVYKQRRARTEEELLEQERLAELAEEEQLRNTEKAGKDRILIDTYSSEDDILLTRDGQISVLESQIKLTENHIEKLQTNLDKMIKLAANKERRGVELNEQSVKDIDNVRQQIASHRRFIEDKRSEQIRVRERFNADLERYRTLTDVIPKTAAVSR